MSVCKIEYFWILQNAGPAFMANSWTSICFLHGAHSKLCLFPTTLTAEQVVIFPLNSRGILSYNWGSPFYGRYRASVWRAIVICCCYYTLTGWETFPPYQSNVIVQVILKRQPILILQREPLAWHHATTESAFWWFSTLSVTNKELTTHKAVNLKAFSSKLFRDFFWMSIKWLEMKEELGNKLWENSHAHFLWGEADLWNAAKSEDLPWELSVMLWISSVITCFTCEVRHFPISWKQ